MKKADLQKYRRQLFDLARRLKDDEAGVRSEALRTAGGESSGGLSNAPMHMADLGSDHFEQETALSLLENGRQILKDTADAIDRVDEGTFGQCQECEQDIPAERLDALPYTPYCVDCAQRLQPAGAPSAGA